MRDTAVGVWFAERTQIPIHSDAAPSILTSALTMGVTLLLDAGTLACYQQSPEGYTSPRVMPRHIRALTLTKGLVRTLQGHQQSSWRTPVLKPSSNSGLPYAWITAPATDASLGFDWIRPRGKKRQSGITSLLVVRFYFKMRVKNLGKKP